MHRDLNASNLDNCFTIHIWRKKVFHNVYTLCRVGFFPLYIYIEGSGYATTATKLAEAEKRQKECKGYWQVYIFRGVGA